MSDQDPPLESFGSAEDLEFEIAVQTVMLESISPLSDTAHQDQERIRKTIVDLEAELAKTRMEAHVEAQLASMRNGGLSTGGQNQMNHGSASNSLGYRSFAVPSPVDRGGGTPLSVNSRKRPLFSRSIDGDEDEEDEDVDVRPSQRSNPFLHVGRPSAAQDVLQKQRARQSQIENDERIAKELAEQFRRQDQNGVFGTSRPSTFGSLSNMVQTSLQSDGSVRRPSLGSMVKRHSVQLPWPSTGPHALGSSFNSTGNTQRPSMSSASSYGSFHGINPYTSRSGQDPFALTPLNNASFNSSPQSSYGTHSAPTRSPINPTFFGDSPFSQHNGSTSTDRPSQFGPNGISQLAENDARPSTETNHSSWLLNDPWLSYQDMQEDPFLAPTMNDASNASTIQSNQPSPTDSSDSLEEITPDSFRPSGRTLALGSIRQNYSQPLQTNSNMHVQMPMMTQGAAHSFALPSRPFHQPSSSSFPRINQLEPLVQIPQNLNSATFSHFTGAVGNAFITAANMAAGMLGSQDNPLSVDNYVPRPVHPPGYPSAASTNKDTMALVENIRTDDDIPKEARMDTPDAMSTRLLEHQKVGLSWMTKQEQGTSKGGILADDMGLGKTIQALALIVSNASKDANNKTTLVIAPLALLEQWKNEIAEKIKPSNKLRVHLYHSHGKRHDHKALRDFDVVLTTYGTLASEYKKLHLWDRAQKETPLTAPKEPPKTALIGTECHWYRIVLDEAQNIKNKDSQSAKGAFSLRATYRWCMTGTPMMNTTFELWPLIHFCRIKPFDDLHKFKSEIGTIINPTSAQQVRGPGGARIYNRALQKLQGLIRAVMLRRTKKSYLDGKPILQLPERTVNTDPVQFDEEESRFYTELEVTAQIEITNLLNGATSGRTFTHMLVRLLRLRQACCHKDLVLFHENLKTMSWLPESSEKLMNLAKKMTQEAITRISASVGEFQCPICLDGSVNPAILLPCGHTTCSECFSQLCDSTAQQESGEGGTMRIKCPVCRGPVNPKEITDYLSFKKVHQPHLLTDEDRALDESESDSDSDDESGDDDSASSLKDFIVDDDDISGEDYETRDVKKEEKKPELKKSKQKKDTKGKQRAEQKKQRNPHQHLVQLKKDSIKNKKSKRRYFKELDKLYTPSAKIVRTIKLIEEVMASKPAEKILVFSQFTTLLDFIEVPLRRANIQYVRYDGSMTTSERNKAVETFRWDADVKVMILSLKAGNSGLNLNIASQVIILDPFWNPYIEEQAIDRAHRIGQRFDVQVHRIVVPNTVEDRILKLQEDKRKIITAALSEEQGREVGRLGLRELRYLFGIN